MEIRHLFWLLACLGNFGGRICEIVNLANKGLTSVPDNISTNVMQLDIQDNAITTIHRTDFNDKYWTLLSINFTNNKLSHFEEGCFNGTHLQSAYFTMNELTAVPDLQYVVRVSLWYLRFDSNRISKLLATDFNNLNLLDLNLTNNSIALIDPGCFKGTTRLGNLHLNLNELTSFPALPELEGILEKLFLDSNKIDNAPLKALSYLTKLTYLSLRFNYLTHLPDFTTVLSGQVTITMEGNPLDCCCNMAWLRKYEHSAYNYQICKYPSQWNSTAWNNITEEMLRNQPCGDKSTPYLCGTTLRHYAMCHAVVNMRVFRTRNSTLAPHDRDNDVTLTEKYTNTYSTQCDNSFVHFRWRELQLECHEPRATSEMYEDAVTSTTNIFNAK
ncbi:hypothetical protein CAPTEDRAFT_210920 [Capitella teleta]|uniref:LRRCT domain-containing protein n=1 Tax=Capitella teleta TaxID=283909 RepID=R7VFK9_CAPTE|nr:hypothetical protein CAPTEDRAFT_210920 [Capitella teleta]|eukprot:ELU14465.1 hypothetical protein CAPTEDRAFT_210920 [Capitella teleta]